MTRIAAAPAIAFDTRRGRIPAKASAKRSVGFGSHIAVQRDGEGPSHDGAAHLVRDVVSSPGQPLDSDTRTMMGLRLGHDFSTVRVHTDNAAARSAAAIGANAYTAGNHIVFGAGQFAPAQPAGQHTVAHELAHVIQQSNGPVSGTPIGDGVSISEPHDPFERSAEASADRAISTIPRGARMPPAAIPAMPDAGSAALAVQRISSTGWAVIGGVAGIAGAGLGLLSLLVAIGAWAKPRNANATAQGITMQPNPFTFQTVQAPPTATDARTKFQSAAEAPPKIDKVLELRTDDDNDATFNLQRNTDGANIISANVVPGETKGYQGGYNSSLATVNFVATQSALAPDTSAPAPQQGPAGTTATAAGSNETPAPTNAPNASPGGTATNAAPTPQMAREVIHFSGTNGKTGDPLQTYAGELLVTGDGTVRCIRCDAMNNIGYGMASGTYGLIDYRTVKPGSGSNLFGPDTNSTPAEPGGLPSLPDLQKMLPFNKPMAGAS